MIWSREFWQGATERALKTLLQTFVAVLTAQVGADAIGVSAGILAPDWAAAVSVAALAAVLSLATSIGNADFTAGHPAPQRAVDADGDGIPDIKEDS